MAWPALNDSQPAKKASTMGIIGLALVVIATIIWVYGWYRFSAVLDATVCPGLAGCTVPPDPTTWPPALSAVLPVWLVGFIGGGVLGLIGLIVSIVATAKKAGRPWGIVGIILGVIAPVAGLIVAVSLAMR